MKISNGIKIAFVSFAVFYFYGTAHADTLIHLSIKTPTLTLYDQDMTVTPCDSDNNSETAAMATPYCAILQLQPEVTSDWSWNTTYSAYYLNSINNISGSVTKDKDGNDVYHYWSWSIGPDVAMVGLSAYELKPDDIISLDFIDPEPEPVPSAGSASCCSAEFSLSLANATIPAPLIKPTFDLQKAFDFIITQQKENGSFGEDLYTDWIALALASGNYQEQTLKLIRYFGESKISGSLLTDYERHAMALMSLGLNPYNTNSENYIEKIANSFDGKQFGDANEDNDDIFALIVLQNAGFTQTDKIITDDLNFILSRQRENGSWDDSVDMTGAATEALSAFSPTPGVGESLQKAKEFLKQSQKDDGGWENVSSTAWALEGIAALKEKPEDWIKNGNTPLDYLATKQDADGGIKNEILTNKIWETAYVASILSGKTWNQIMQKFEKPETPAVVKVVAKSPKKIIKKEMVTAAAINAITDSPAPIQIKQTETPKENWFIKFLGKIFSIF